MTNKERETKKKKNEKVKNKDAKNIYIERETKKLIDLEYQG